VFKLVCKTPCIYAIPFTLKFFTEGTSVWPAEILEQIRARCQLLNVENAERRAGSGTRSHQIHGGDFLYVPVESTPRNHAIATITTKRLPFKPSSPWQLIHRKSFNGPLLLLL